MKNLVYLLFVFIFPGSSFTYKTSHTVLITPVPQALTIHVKTEQPQTATSTDGSLHITINGGTAPYTVQVVSTVSPSQVFKKDKIELKKLSAGNYTIMVQDANKQVVQKIIELTPVQ